MWGFGTLELCVPHKARRRDEGTSASGGNQGQSAGGNEMQKLGLVMPGKVV